ncbi:MAG: hypothetical protein JWN54_1685 [Mycobacterium sp.]|nr:hypothetical protein [Mycobacterium sp.]
MFGQDGIEPASWYEMRPAVAFGWVWDQSSRDNGAAFHGTTTRSRTRCGTNRGASGGSSSRTRTVGW